MRKRKEPVLGNVQRVFILNLQAPTRRIIEIDALIVVTDKRTWAETPSGKRHLLGASAFYTEASANRAKRGALVKIVETRFLLRNPRTADVYYSAEQQLMRFDATGHFTPPRKQQH